MVRITVSTTLIVMQVTMGKKIPTKPPPLTGEDLVRVNSPLPLAPSHQGRENHNDLRVTYALSLV